jgi:hypothetical protein
LPEDQDRRVWDRAKRLRQGKNMSVVATAAADWNEDDETKNLIASIEQVIGIRYPSDAALIRDVQYITDRDQLRHILDLSTTAHFADIQSAVLPPK